MNKCDGIKILELDPKRNLEGSEYMVVAEKEHNYKAPINQIVDIVINNDRIKDYIDATIESSIGDFKNEVNQSISELTSSSNHGQANEEFAVVNYFDKTEAGQVVALNPIT